MFHACSRLCLAAISLANFCWAAEPPAPLLDPARMVHPPQAARLPAAASSVTPKGVLLYDMPARWANGQVTWYYNPSGRPSDVSDSEIINFFKNAFADWENVCQVTGTYGGVTSVDVNNANEIVVVGYKDIGDFAFMDAGPRFGSRMPYPYFSGGAIRININSTQSSLRSRLDNGGIRAARHELGHLLNFHHSDDPYSILYAAPYLSEIEDLTGDDIAICAELYGGRGMITLPDHSNALLEPGSSGMRILIADRFDNGGTPPPALQTLDVSTNAYFYFNLAWNSLTIGDAIAWRFITPAGTTWETYDTTARSSAGGTALPRKNFPFNGKWQIQAVVKGKVAAKQEFTVQGGSLAPLNRIEYALIAEQASNGNITPRLDNYSSIGAKRIEFYPNGSTGPLVTGAPFVPLASTQNQVELWLQSDQPRYPYDPNKYYGGNDSDSANNIRRLNFTTNAQGRIDRDLINYDHTGSQFSYFGTAHIQIAQTGPMKIYQAALVGSKWYYRTRQGWSDIPAELSTLTAPGAITFSALTAMDIRWLPAGTTLYVGYGTSLEDVVNRGQYKLVQTF